MQYENLFDPTQWQIKIQIIALIIFSVCISGVGYIFIINERIMQISAQHQTLRQLKINYSQQYIKMITLQKNIVKAEKLKERYQKILVKINESFQLDNFVSQVMRLSQLQQVKIQSIIPKKNMTPQENESLVLNVTGDYPNLCHFLHGLQALEPLILVKFLSINSISLSAPNDSQELKVEVMLELF